MYICNRSSHQRCSIVKRVLRNFTIFTGKHLCQSFFFNEVGTGVFLWKQEHFRTTVSDVNISKWHTNLCMTALFCQPCFFFLSLFFSCVVFILALVFRFFELAVRIIKPFFITSQSRNLLFNQVIQYFIQIPPVEI